MQLHRVVYRFSEMIYSDRVRVGNNGLVTQGSCGQKDATRLEGTAVYHVR